MIHPTAGASAAADDPPVHGGLIVLVDLFEALWPDQDSDSEADPAGAA